MQEAVEILRKNFPFEPTNEQQLLFEKLQYFIEEPSGNRSTFLLKGYAGTGKTTTLNALTKTLKKHGYRVVLIAPTGRAAKVISKHTKQPAFTIHRQIYKQVQHPYTGAVDFKLKKNYLSKAVFIVDEASMINHDCKDQESTMLTDLINYVFEHSGNKMVIVGDPAQLPPVGQGMSLALNEEILQYVYQLKVFTHQLTEVTRQSQQSGILANATELRNQLRNEHPKLFLRTDGYYDIYNMHVYKLLNGLQYTYLKYGINNALLICASNQEAAQYNQFIREKILKRQSIIEKGDLLMVARNNYHVLSKKSKLKFLANGEFVEVVQVLEEEELHGFKFATLALKLPDYPRQPVFVSKIFLETLNSNFPCLPENRSRELYTAISADYEYIELKSKRYKAIRKDDHLNALQVKFAYALTCHKAQGGQWQAVFVNQGFLAKEALSSEKLKWLYTAFTRATDELYLIDFDKDLFIHDGLLQL